MVGGVGGSGGASHVAWCAATGVSGDDKLDAAVCLSAAYKFYDDKSLKTPNPCINKPCTNYGFCKNVTDYCQVDRGGDDDPNCTNGTLSNPPNPALMAASPIDQMMPDETSPLLAFATYQDFMPQGQFDSICAKVNDFNEVMMTECGDAANLQYRAIEFQAANPDDKHSFAYWFDYANTAFDNVNSLAKNFLCAHLGSICSP